MREMTPILWWWQLAKYTPVKSFTFRKVSAKICNFRVPVNKGVPLPWMKWHPSFNEGGAKCTPVKSFTCWKVSAKICNFRVPVYKGVPLLWMKWNLCFNDDWLQSLIPWKVSLSEKWVLNYTTLGLPFIRGFPSHKWNESHSLTMTGCQLHYCENIRFLKSKC